MSDLALNPQGDREIRLGRRWVRRDIPFRYAFATPALAEPYFPVAQTPPEILGPPFSETFPYAVLYLEEADHIAIYAIAHFKRRPGYWRERLR